MNFINPDYEQYFNKYGYIKLPAFVNDNILSELQGIYSTLLKDKSKGAMYSNYHDLSFTENEAIKEKIVSKCSDILGDLLCGYRIVGASYIIKGAGGSSDSRIHQDWSIVDERKYKSLVFWIPLVAVNEQNGCLQIIPESHLWFNTIRSESISSLFLKFNATINRFLTAVPLNKGDAAMFSMKVFHGSKQNRSEQERPAVVLTLIDKEARYIYSHQDKDGSVKILDCNDTESYQKAYDYFKGRTKNNAVILKELGKYTQVDEYHFFKKLYTSNLPRGIFYIPILILLSLRKYFYGFSMKFKNRNASI